MQGESGVARADAILTQLRLFATLPFVIQYTIGAPWGISARQRPNLPSLNEIRMFISFS